jgi:26S proteasome non-ATPase regulatory subunit 10
LVALGLTWSNLAFCDEIHDAAQDGDLAKVQALLRQNPSLISSKDNNGATPLHMAASGGHKDIVNVLLG